MMSHLKYHVRYLCQSLFEGARVVYANIEAYYLARIHTHTLTHNYTVTLACTCMRRGLVITPGMYITMYNVMCVDTTLYLSLMLAEKP